MNGKVVIITGASSGIGRACAMEFSKRGANVVLAARNERELEVLIGRIGKDKSLAVKTDVSKEEDCKKLIEATLKRFNKIDILINNAGISMRALFHELDLKVLRQLMDVNFWGTIYCTRYSIQHIRSSKGSVVGVSSIGGFTGLPGRTGYSASKFAMHGFLESLRLENRKDNVHVLIACPGFTETNIRQTALTKDGSTQNQSPRDEAKMMSAEKVAEHIANAVVKRKKIIVLSTLGKLTAIARRFIPNILEAQVYKNFAKEEDSPFK